MGEAVAFGEIDGIPVGTHFERRADVAAAAIHRAPNRVIDRHVSVDRRLVFHSLRHAFKSKGNDAGLTDRTLDQICGHAPVSTGGRYGSEPRVRTIHRDLHKIDFSCINWIAIAEGAEKVIWKAVLRV